MSRRSIVVLALALGLAALTVPGTAAADTGPATVHLVVETHPTARADVEPGQAPGPAPGTAECDVTVPAGADGGAVLDRAVETGCIASWDFTTFSGQRFVTSIDRWRAPGLTCLAFEVGVCDWWQYHVNGETAGFGVDGYSAEDGDTNRWVYRNTLGDDTAPE